jgi:acetyl-CoA carboxylase carboxyltransferase component
LSDIWKKQAESLRARGSKMGSIPTQTVRAVELCLDGDGKLVEINRPAAQNKVGMVAWRYTLCTPEYPAGRDVIVIANDITVQAGSFGPQEDFLFDAASKLAREEGIPRVYIAANSGARIGLAEEVRACFKAAWVDPSDPAKGFKYLYLSTDDYERLCRSDSAAYKEAGAGSNSVNAKKVVEDGEERWVIQDIVGEKDGLGVECLAGSGLIAGETSKAYDEIFTLTYVMSRSVGIGAYLVRLGQRVIQKKTDAPIILTGMESLNKLLGRDVYQSNSQLGGIRVMYANGVSHLVVDDDLEGATAILDWLAFVPRTKDARLPIKEMGDPINRPIDFVPGKQGNNDTREMLAGREDGSKWVSGFFDHGSWVETLAGWAKNVIVGRARLGGIPIGVIAVETATVDKVMPADPADPTTQEVVQPQAAQVWFPDSSFKTANAISDFNREKLPLMVFANWRGFSGGTRDMFDEILKFGSYIVDELVDYKQPVMVYIPRHAELRGGAWVVIDPNINSERMEMFADTHAAGGVLEAEGTVVVKYRKPMLLKTMRRLDATLQHLDNELQMAVSKFGQGSALVEQIVGQVQAREKELLPIYHQLATKFAELHDTPGRMKAKGVIDAVVPWEVSREFFYWRIRRRLEESSLRKQLVAANPMLTPLDLTELLHGWFTRYEVRAGPRRSASTEQYTEADLVPLEQAKRVAAMSEDYDTAARLKRQIEGIKAQLSSPTTSLDSAMEEQGWDDDRRIIDWLDADEEEIQRRVESQRKRYILEQVVGFGKEDMGALVEGLQRLVDEVGSDELHSMLKGTLRGPLIFGAQGSEVSTARDLSPEARSSPFATPGQK